MSSAVTLSGRAGPVYRPVGRTRQARLRDLERRARGSWLLGGPSLPYDAECWDVTEVLPWRVGPAQSRTRQRLWLSAAPGHRGAKPMWRGVIGFAKAYVRLSSEGLGISALRARLYAVRYLGDALAEAGALGIEDCSPATFDAALAIARTALGERSAHEVAVQLEALARYMGECRLARNPVGTWRRTATAASPHVDDGPEAGLDPRLSPLLPTEEFLVACAKAFQVSDDERDVIVSSVLALLGCAGSGSRIGEVLRVREDARTRNGLILPGSKGADEHVRVVLASMAELADVAVARLLGATAEGRMIKRAYDRDPTRLHLPPDLAHVRGKALLTMNEAAAILGLKPGAGFHRLVRDSGLALEGGPVAGLAAGRRLSFATVERHLLSRLGEHMRLAGGRDYHPLLVVRWRQFATETGSPCMFESIGYQTLHRSIRPIRGRPSIFKRQGLDPSGTVTGESKSIRHLLNTLAHMVGLSEEDVAETSGRVGTGHNRRYNHTPPEAALDDLDGFARHRERKRGKGGDDGR